MSVDYCGCPLCWSLTAPVGDGVGLETVTNTSIAQPTIFDLVKRDLDGRDRVGAIQHNDRRLTGACGYDWLREAYEEALDLCVYLRGALAEREGKK